MGFRGHYTNKSPARMLSIPTLLLLAFFLSVDPMRVSAEDTMTYPTTAANRLFNYADAILLSPTNITVAETTTTSVLLKWSAGTMLSRPEYLIYKLECIRSYSRYDYWNRIVDVIDICNGSLPYGQNDISNSRFPANLKCWEDDVRYYYFNVTDLSPFTHYDVRIFARFPFENERTGWHSAGFKAVRTKYTLNLTTDDDPAESDVPIDTVNPTLLLATHTIAGQINFLSISQ